MVRRGDKDGSVRGLPGAEDGFAISSVYDELVSDWWVAIGKAVITIEHGEFQLASFIAIWQGANVTRHTTFLMACVLVIFACGFGCES